MKYRDDKVRLLLKEFRSFSKWAPKGIYAQHGNAPKDQEEYFLQRIKQIMGVEA